MADKDFYAILKIPPRASAKDIKAAYRKLALKYHPDHNPGNKSAENQFKKILEAYEYLSDPIRKQNYDAQFKPSRKKAAKKKASKKATTSTAKKTNLRYNVFVTLEEVLSGCQKSISYIRNVDGQKQPVKIKIDVPAGVTPSQRLRVSQYGDQSFGVRGDLYVIVHIQDHPIFRREGLNLSVDVPINYLQALLGEPVDVPTLEGIHRLRLRPHQFSRAEIPLKYKGLPDQKTGERGHIFVNCIIDHPSSLTIKQKKELQKLVNSWPMGEKMKQYQAYLQSIRK